MMHMHTLCLMYIYTMYEYDVTNMYLMYIYEHMIHISYLLIFWVPTKTRIRFVNDHENNVQYKSYMYKGITVIVVDCTRPYNPTIA